MLNSYTHHLVWSHLHIVKPQVLQVRSALHMMNHAAYSCTHHLLWSHLHIIKPQSLQVGSGAQRLYRAANSCTQKSIFSIFFCIVLSFVLDYSCQAKLTYWCHEHIGKPVSICQEHSSDVELSCRLLHLEERFLHCFCIVLSFVLDHSCQAKLTYWCHDHIGKPVSICQEHSSDVEFLHPSPFMESSSHCQATVFSGWERRSYV